MGPVLGRERRCRGSEPRLRAGTAPSLSHCAPTDLRHCVLGRRKDRDWDGTRLCVGGQSAGGNLSAAAARLALENCTPVIALQVLHYAPLDLATPTRDKPSTIGARAVLKPWMGEVFDTAYIPDRAQRPDRLASPAWGANADEIVGIAPAVVVTAEHDRLRDEAHRYAEKLHAAGSLIEYHEVTGVDDGYNIMSGALDVTRAVYSRIAGHVARATGSP